MRPGIWAPAAVLLTLALSSDAESAASRACYGQAWPNLPADLRQLGEDCAALSARTRSPGAALKGAAAFLLVEDYPRARQVLAPFENADHADVLIQLAYLDSREGFKERCRERYRRAAELSRSWANPQSYALAAGDLGFQLLEANRFEEAIRILEPLRNLPFDHSRNPRIWLVSALRRFGDLSAAEAELNRLEVLRHQEQPSRHELLIEGQLRLAQGQIKTAEHLLQRLRERMSAEGRKAKEVEALINLVEVANAEGAWVQARLLAAEARTEPLAPEDVHELAYRDGIAAREAGQLDDSLVLLRQAQTGFPDPAQSWRVENELGKTLERLGRTEEAVAAYLRSIAEIEALRSALGSASLQAWVTESRREPYLAVFELRARQTGGPAALRMLERFLGNGLTEQVASASERQAREPLQALERGDALRGVAAADTGLRPAADDLRLGRAPFVAFIEGRRNLWRIQHRGAETTIDELSIPASDFCVKAERFARDVDDDRLAAEVGKLLFGASLPGGIGQRFALVPPRCARNLPFAAVRVGGRRLADLAVVAAAPDLTTASGGRVRSARDAVARLVMADPRRDLPAAGSEATAVARQLDVQPLLGSAATSAALLQAPPLRLLHLATHAEVTPVGPALVLADGLFDVRDILTAHLAPTLVVLATCRSGSVAESSARDTLASAFLRAGSAQVLATFRSVEDALAAQVVERFYQAGGLADPALALTRVQRAMATTEPPSRWAVFFIAGSADAPAAPAHVTLGRRAGTAPRGRGLP